MSFADDILKFTQKTEKKFAKVVKGTVINIGRELVERSPTGQWDKWLTTSQEMRPRPPYAPGEFVGSWQFTTGIPSSSYTPTIDVTGESSMNRFREINAVTEIAGVFTLYNNAPYGDIMENSTNWLYPPNVDGVVRHTMNNAKGTVAKVVAWLAA